MILRSIEMESFGKFKSRTFEFRRGMNLVIGPNEAGKSTLAESVPAVLFGTDHLEKYKTWGRNACVASLFFEGGGRTIEVKRNLVTDEVELVEKDDMYHVLSQFSGKAPLRGRSSSCREYRELVAKLLGVGDDKLFRATYYFGHHPQEWSGDELAQNLRTLVSGTAEADYAEILDELLEEHFSLTCSNPWGRDKKQPREYEEICQQIAETGAKETVPVFVEIDNTSELANQVEALEAELVKDRLEYEKGVRYIEHVRRSAGHAEPVAPVVEERKSPEPARTAQEVPTDDIRARLAAAGLPENPPRDLPSLLAEAAEIRLEMAELQQPYASISSSEKKIPTVPWMLMITVLCLSSVGVAAAWWLQLFLIAAAAVAGVASLVSVAWCVWRHTNRTKALAECKKQRSRLDQKKVAAQSKQAELSERCEALGLPSSPIDLVRLQKLVASHRDLLDAYWGTSAQVPSEPGGKSGESSSAVTEVTSDEPKIDTFVELDDEADDELPDLEKRLAEFAGELKSKEARLKSLKEQIATMAEVNQTPAIVDGAGLFRRKYELEERIGILRKAVDLLADSVEEFGTSHLTKLNEEAGRVFGKITSGRYQELRLDENMLPFVKLDGRRWMPVDRFSRGTVDAIYLALRVALAKVRDDGRSLPLMLDDPFVHLDQKRLSKALNAVDLASADGQLILFSHNMELGKRAAKERWHVVPLDEDKVTATHDEEEGGEHAGQLHLL